MTCARKGTSSTARATAWPPIHRRVDVNPWAGLRDTLKTDAGPVGSMRGAVRIVVLSSAGLVALLLLIVASATTASLLREGTVSAVESSMLAALFTTGGLAAWGVTMRRAGPIRAAALVFGIHWLSYSAYLLALPRPGFQTEISSTIRQHAAIVVLVAGTFLAAASALDDARIVVARRVTIAFAALFGLVALGGFAWGAPGREIPGSPVPLALGAIGLASLATGLRARRASWLLAGAGILLVAALVGAAWHLVLDVDKPVAIFSYAGPAGLALAPAIVLIFEEARQLGDRSLR